MVYLSEISLQVYLDSENFVNASKGIYICLWILLRNSNILSFLGGSYLHGELVDSSLHLVAVNNSYRCNSEETFELSLMEEIGDVALIHIAHMQTEAFRTQIDDKFHSGKIILICNLEK